MIVKVFEYLKNFSEKYFLFLCSLHFQSNYFTVLHSQRRPHTSPTSRCRLLCYPYCCFCWLNADGAKNSKVDCWHIFGRSDEVVPRPIYCIEDLTVSDMISVYEVNFIYTLL